MQVAAAFGAARPVTGRKSPNAKVTSGHLGELVTHSQLHPRPHRTWFATLDHRHGSGPRQQHEQPCSSGSTPQRPEVWGERIWR